VSEVRNCRKYLLGFCRIKEDFDFRLSIIVSYNRLIFMVSRSCDFIIKRGRMFRVCLHEQVAEEDAYFPGWRA